MAIEEGYKHVLYEGLPQEDGSYLLILKGDYIPRLFVRYSSDGNRKWVSPDRRQIEEADILMYKRILITPESGPK
jgi:hypothetical protein